MDQEKIGKFIKQKRTEKKLTQSELANMLNITDRAISKWENGICMPDVGIIPDLCNILNITISDLFSGKVNEMKNNGELEKSLLEIAKQKEDSDKKLLNLEIILALVGILPLLISIVLIIFLPISENLKAIILLLSMTPLLVALPFLIKIEQIAGYYECSKCKKRYVPSYNKVFIARHIGRKRLMKCKFCNKRAWHKKVITKDKN